MTDKQFVLLQKFVDAADRFITTEDAMTYDQRTLRSFGMRRWISRKKSGDFFITDNGLNAWNAHFNANVFRKEDNWNQPLSRYFDEKVYGLRIIHHNSKKGAA